MDSPSPRTIELVNSFTTHDRFATHVLTHLEELVGQVAQVNDLRREDNARLLSLLDTLNARQDACFAEVRAAQYVLTHTGWYKLVWYIIVSIAVVVWTASLLF